MIADVDVRDLRIVDDDLVEAYFSADHTRISVRLVNCNFVNNFLEGTLTSTETQTSHVPAIVRATPIWLQGCKFSFNTLLSRSPDFDPRVHTFGVTYSDGPDMFQALPYMFGDGNPYTSATPTSSTGQSPAQAPVEGLFETYSSVPLPPFPEEFLSGTDPFILGIIQVCIVMLGLGILLKL